MSGDGEGKIEIVTFESCAHPGKPLSLANAHVMRELEARNPIVPQMPNATTIVVMAVAPPMVPTACWNISMKGYPVGVRRAASTSPRQKRTARSMPKPRKPFKAIPVIIDRGTFTEGFWISSDICWVA